MSNVKQLRPAASPEAIDTAILMLACDFFQRGSPYPEIASRLLRIGSSLLLQGNPQAALEAAIAGQVTLNGARRILEGRCNGQ